jgi:hypothetical protein
VFAAADVSDALSDPGRKAQAVFTAKAHSAFQQHAAPAVVDDIPHAQRPGRIEPAMSQDMVRTRTDDDASGGLILLPGYVHPVLSFFSYATRFAYQRASGLSSAQSRTPLSASPVLRTVYS